MIRKDNGFKLKSGPKPIIYCDSNYSISSTIFRHIHQPIKFIYENSVNISVHFNKCSEHQQIHKELTKCLQQNSRKDCGI